MAKFAKEYTFRTPLRTIEFKAGNETVDAEVIEAATKAGALVEEQADDKPTARSPKSGTLHIKV
jgi:hypothetical protein